MKRFIVPLFVSVFVVHAHSDFGSTFRVSLRSNGQQLNRDVLDIAISADGRFSAFSTADDSVVEGDSNGVSDVFLRDEFTGVVKRVSVSSGGTEGNGPSHSASLSAGGRYVVFVSAATNLVPGDQNGFEDVFWHDTITGSTVRVSVPREFAEANGSSSEPVVNANGNVVAFRSSASNLVLSDNNGVSDVFVCNVKTRALFCISRSPLTGAFGNGPSRSPSVDASGTLICFSSEASNLIGNDNNNFEDVFLNIFGYTGRVSRGVTLNEGNGPSFDPHISSDGGYIVYASRATNFYPGDTNGVTDLFSFDLLVYGTQHLRLTPAGVEPDGDSYAPSVSWGSKIVAFASDATNLVQNDKNGAADVFIRDKVANETVLVSKSTNGTNGNSGSLAPQVSNSGAVAFLSNSTQLVPGDTNDRVDAFVHRSLKVRPSTLEIQRGRVVMGDLASTFYSADDDELSILPGSTFHSASPAVSLVTETAVSRITPLALSFSIKSCASSMDVVQTIELFDFDANQYEVSEVVQLTNSFTMATKSYATAVAARFVSETGTIRARLSYKATGTAISYPWQVKIDHITWEIYE